MIKAALYLRVSSDIQAKEGDSIPAQRDALRKYAKDHGMIIAGEYVDDGISGTKYSQRDELQRMLSDVEAGKIDIIIFTKLDRFFRSVRHYTATQAVLDAHGVGWLAIWEPIYDTTTPQGRLIVNQMMSIAQFEAENTSQRIKQVQAYKLSQKEVISGTHPAGFRIVGKHLEHDENAEHVRKAFEMYALCGSINETMRVYGGSCGMPSSKPAFKRMLMSPLYKGEHYTGIKDYCPPIVSADLWDDVQRKLKMNVKSSQKHVYIFSGLLRCADCGGTMGGNTRRRIRGRCRTEEHQYRCARYYNQKPSKCTNSKTIAENTVERYLIEHIRPMVEGLILKYEIEKSEDKTIQISEQKKRIERKLERLKELYINELIDMTAYKADRERLLADMDKLSGTESERREQDVDALKQLLSADLWTLYGTFTNEEKRAFWRGIIDRIEYGHDKQFRIYFL